MYTYTYTYINMYIYINVYQKFFCPIVSNHRFKTFFLLKNIDIIDVSYSPSIIGIDLIDVFSPSVPTHGNIPIYPCQCGPQYPL